MWEGTRVLRGVVGVHRNCVPCDLGFYFYFRLPCSGRVLGVLVVSGKKGEKYISFPFMKLKVQEMDSKNGLHLLSRLRPQCVSTGLSFGRLGPGLLLSGCAI